MTSAFSGRPSAPPPAAESPYTFRELLKDAPVTTTDDDTRPYITCVDYWESNLYIGASNGELLHFVAIPGENDSESASFILASRQEPPFTSAQAGDHPPGVRQILLLPSVKKACVVCNGTYSFYTLPELSPAFGGKIKQGNCNWVGGLDEDRTYEDGESVVIVICLKQRIRVIRIGEQAKMIRDIDLPGCIDVRRRGDLACVADDKSYSLIDVGNQQKIDLFPISSIPALPSRTPSPTPRLRPRDSDLPQRPVSMQFPNNLSIRSGMRGHERISSLGAEPRNTDRLTPESPSQWPSRRSSRQFSPAPDSSPGTPTRDRSPLGLTADNQERPLPAQPEAEAEVEPSRRPPDRIKPVILSPTSGEFLLTTGTTADEPGVGMFINHNGDVCRGTLEFSSYPSAVILDDGASTADPSQPSSVNPSDSHIVALTASQDGRVMVIETQGLDPGSSEKAFLPLPDSDASNPQSIGLRRSVSANTIATPNVVQALGLRRFRLDSRADQVDTPSDQKRIAQEDALIERFATTATTCLLFRDLDVYWLVRHPLLLKLDAQLDETLRSTATNGLLMVQRHGVEVVYNTLRGRDPQDEIQFMTFNFIRQKAAALLFLDILIKTAQEVSISRRDIEYTQDALQSSGIEPRLILGLIPMLRSEVTESKQGIWAPGGLVKLLEQIKLSQQLSDLPLHSQSAHEALLPLLGTFLQFWRKKKGFGSIADESFVFSTVDASLLHVLLLLDSRSPSGPARPGSLRAELNEVVDRGVDCVDRALTLMEQYRRLYLLSRLYQSQKKSALVLATWRRILDGEEDLGGELTDGETDVRKYLTKIKDASLVKEYGAWLANRNPPLGVQVFADDASRVKFTPAEAVSLLKDKAPNAVQHFLEYLVFAKKQSRYASDLVSFYLASLLETLESSESAREALKTTIEVYSSLSLPKQTFLSFTEDNAPQEEWHRHRMRLLQLLATTSPLDFRALASRISPFSSLLIPESIILASRSGDHPAAIHALVHVLADHDTATRYCLRSGRSVYPTPATPSASPDPSNPSQRRLFSLLLSELFKLSDPGTRRDLASNLLARFGSWFDAPSVLGQLPDDWPVQHVEGFLTTALRQLVAEKRETKVVAALAAGENLKVSVEVADAKSGYVVQDDGEVGDEGAGQGKSWADSGYGSLPRGQGTAMDGLTGDDSG